MRDLLGVARAWASVHHAWAGALLIALAALASVLLATTVITDFGVFRLAVPVSALLLVPVLAGTGAAMASVTDARLPLPDPPRALVMRTLWAVGCTLVAALAVLPGALWSDQATPGAVLRNVVLHAGLGLLLARTDGRLIWVPAALVTLLAMLFGQAATGDGVAAWAFLLDPQVRAAHLVATAVVFLAGLLVVVLPSRRSLP